MDKVLGFDESVTTCDCCGKADLKGTFGVERNGGEILHYGSVCVTRHTGKSAKVVRKEAKDATDERRRAAVAEFKAHPSVAALRAKRDAVRAAGVSFGRSFVEETRDEWMAEDAARAAIAAKHGLKFYELHD
jgi:hypothetical protein